MRLRKAIFTAGLWAVLLLPLQGVETAFWQVGTFEDFLQGTLRDVSLSKEGALKLAPETRVVFAPEETLALSLAADAQNNLYVGTGHQGKVYRVDSSSKGTLFFTAQEPGIFALALGPDGALYVGSSPEGRIYRVALDGTSKIFADPKAKYIWSLAFDKHGNLYAGTGDQGKIFKVDPTGKAEVFFDSKQTHIMCLILEREGNLLAGSVPNGLIYRVTPQGKAFALYQANLPEIHDLAIDSEGRIYAAALGGAGGKGTQELFVPAPAATPGATTITVVASRAEADKPGAQTPPTDAQSSPSFNRPAPQSVAVPVTSMPQGKGALIQIDPDSTVETVWSSNNESIFGLAVRNDGVLFSTDSNGRIFQLSPKASGRGLTLLTVSNETLATRLMTRGNDVIVATSNVAKVLRVGGSPGREGTYESPVKDTKAISRWGVMAWRADLPAETRLELYSRSGNSERPDKTWSDWAGPYANINANPVTSPPARFIQWKAVLRGSGAATPTLHEVTLTYLNQNLPPQIRSLQVSTSGERTGTSASPSSGATVVTVTAGSTTYSPSSTGGNPPKAPTTLSWQAEDPNGDRLVYSLYARSADEQEWHLLRDDLRQTTYTVEPNSVADGKYVARLVASDQESNPPGLARQEELLSAPFWIDNTPPTVRVLRQSAGAGGVEVQYQVEDATSPLRSAETTVASNEWRDIYSDDGIVDSQRETFTVKVEKLDPGEHVVVLRASDTAGNAGVGKAVVRVPPRAGVR